MLTFPERTKKLLEQDQNCNAFVRSSVANLTEWLSDNKTVFFPEYTDHGFTHLNEVLLTADSIISNESWDELTPQDAAAMVASVLLHDCAMHLSEEGFYTIISDLFPVIESRFIDSEMKWSELWTEFMAEAKRFNAKKLQAIFGDEEPVRDIPKNKIELTGRDKLLIGEFIRRHHARIAHEIAFNGVPGGKGNALKLGDEPEKNFLDLCGFIARSHNMELRSAVDKLDAQKKRIHLGAHVPFIMLVLRISDYIQIHSERAPKSLLKIKTLISPISVGEWKKHQSIVEVLHNHDDPEAIYVDAEPEDAIVYESLTTLFQNIQHELDLSWSVLGEVYGRHVPLDKLGITIRRIRSSLDNVDEFISVKKPKYIPKTLKFKTADSEMMSLLVSPLYGNEPTIGIRELLQNSIDACVERKDLFEKGQLEINNEADYDVGITLTDFGGGKGGEIIIEDYGIGMTLEVIENYFLNIGASFRNSDCWKKDHETQGHSDVYRTGRFGIGLLAAYLLGDELKVETRHVAEKASNGLAFNCRKDSDSIIVTNICADIGTKITIKLKEDVKKTLIKHQIKWDWFFLSSPKVIRGIISENEDVLKQRRVFPSSGSDLVSGEWQRTVVEGYDDILWTYEHFNDPYFSEYNGHEYFNQRGRNSTYLVCNGINITKDLDLTDFAISKRMGLIAADIPSIVVFDQDGRLPINLQRTGLVTKTLPFSDQMVRDVSNYLARGILNYCEPLNFVFSKSFLSDLMNIRVEGLRQSYSDGICKFILSDNSLLPMDSDLIRESKIDHLCIDAANLSDGKGLWSSKEFKKICTHYLLIDNIKESKSSRTWWVRNFFEYSDPVYGKRQLMSFLPITGKRILIKKTDISDIVTVGYVPKTFWKRLSSEWENSEWNLMSIGKVPQFEGDITQLVKDLDGTQSFGAIFYYLNWGDEIVDDEEKDTSPFAQAWLNENNQSVTFGKN